MKVYRIKHLPTGLYYCPSREIRLKSVKYSYYVKSNLSKKGKFYPKKPTLKWLGHTCYTHVQWDYSFGVREVDPVEERSRRRDFVFKVIPEEWEIEEAT